MYRVLISIFLIFLISCSNETSDCYGCDLDYFEWNSSPEGADYDWRYYSEGLLKEYPWDIPLTNVDDKGVLIEKTPKAPGDSIFIESSLVVVKLYLTINSSIKIQMFDYETGDIIYPYPQDKIKWYQSKSYNTEEILIESISARPVYIENLLDEYKRVDMVSEGFVSRSSIVVSVEMCDGEGSELTDLTIDCGFELINAINLGRTLFVTIPLKNNRTLGFTMYEDDEEDEQDKKNLPGILD